MRKTTIAIAALLSSAIAVPAHANDAVRLGVGILGLVISEATKGGGKGGNQRRPGKGDQMIGRVGEEPARNNRARSGNKVAGGAAAVAGGATVAALALPDGDQIPVPVTKPTEQEMAEYAALLASSPSTAEEQFDESVPLYDEQGRYWGAVAPDDVEKVEKAVALGMKPSTVIPDMLGLKLPEIEVQSAQVPLIASTSTTSQQAAQAEGDLKAAVVAESSAGSTAVEVVPVVDKVEAAEVVPAVPPTTTEAVASAPTVDVTATTSSVKSEPKVDLEPSEPIAVKKPKAKLDL